MTCTCPDQNATGYQVIFQYNDLQNVDSLLELMVNSSNCSQPVMWNAKKNGTYYITVFPIKAERGIIDSVALHSEEVVIGPHVNLSTTVAPSDDNDPGTIINTTMYDTCLFYL